MEGVTILPFMTAGFVLSAWIKKTPSNIIHQELEGAIARCLPALIWLPLEKQECEA
ncbi:hypothetical protein ACQ4M4_04370 [Leptolyngbya sp. AN02str]|uniref:hypothetical protein n=1 Tax=Leptolyngbya sp. AN02str TaxID=3423363 RepID=UPI003D313978